MNAPTRRNVRITIVFVLGVLGFHSIGGSWVLSALTVGTIVAVTRLRYTGNDRRGRQKRGVAADAPVHARRTLTLAIAPEQALALAAGSIRTLRVAERSVRVDPSSGTATARVRMSFDGRLWFWGERLRTQISATAEGSEVELASDPIGPSEWDAGKNEANVEAWMRELWRQASVPPVVSG